MPFGFLTQSRLCEHKNHFSEENLLEILKKKLAENVEKLVLSIFGSGKFSHESPCISQSTWKILFKP